MANKLACVALGVLGTWWATESPTFAQTAPVNIAVDATAPPTALKHVWPYYGYDEVNYTTTGEGRALLEALVAMNGDPVYIRTHFLLNTDAGPTGLKWGSTNVYTEDAQGNPIYDWTIMDGVMDTLTGSGAFPYVEIGFMPQALSSRPNPYRNSTVRALDGGLFYPPTDYAKWGNLIREWASHAKARYPDAESTWQWQLWNEPDINYWQGTVAEFNRLYDFTEAALHDVLPAAPLGGPETLRADGFMREFLVHCAQGTNAVTGATGTRLDMVTFHAKGGVGITGGNVRMNMGSQLRQHRDGFNLVAEFPEFRSKPIIIGEADPDGCAACPTSDVPANAYRNSPAYGAYEVVMMKRSLELEARAGVNLRALVTWAFTFVPEAYFSGFRELANNGIHKTVLNAFKLLGSLDESRLPVTSSGARSLDDILVNSVRAEPDVDAMATLGADGKVSVLAWNYHDDLVTAAPTPVLVNVALPASFGDRAIITHLRVDETHGDAHTVWVRQGSPTAPSAAQIAEMREAMEPALLEPVATVDVVDGAVALEFELPRFGISLVTLAREAALEPVIDDPGEPVEPPAAFTPGNSPVVLPGMDEGGSVVAEEPSNPNPAPPPELSQPTPDGIAAPLPDAAPVASGGCMCRTGGSAGKGSWGVAMALGLWAAVLTRRRERRARRS